MQGNTEGNNDSTEIPEKARLETCSPDPPWDKAKEADTKRTSDQYPSLLVPLVETTDEPNKVLSDLSGVFIDNNPSPDGDEAYGDNTHGSQELMQVCPIGSGP